MTSNTSVQFGQQNFGSGPLPSFISSDHTWEFFVINKAQSSLRADFNHDSSGFWVWCVLRLELEFGTSQYSWSPDHSVWEVLQFP